MDAKLSAQLLEQIATLHAQDEYFAIIALLEKQDSLDYPLALAYARACLNAARKTNDSFSLTQKAQQVLDSFAQMGRDDVYYLFYKGFALYLEGLIHESMTRLERALGLISVSADPQLLQQVNNLYQLCKGKLIEAEFVGLDAQRSALILEHICEHFGQASLFASCFKTSIYHIMPTAEHPYHVLVTCGLSAKQLNVQKGQDEALNSHLELAIMLPENYEFKDDLNLDWPVFLLRSLIEHVICTQDFIGFGYYLAYDKPFSAATNYRALMLSALGDYAGTAQSCLLDNGRLVHFYQILPLKEMELHYRSKHTAAQLLELFLKAQISLTPIDESRPDVCQGVDSRGV